MGPAPIAARIPGVNIPLVPGHRRSLLPARGGTGSTLSTEACLGPLWLRSSQGRANRGTRRQVENNVDFGLGREIG